MFLFQDRLRPRSREWEGPKACFGRDRPRRGRSLERNTEKDLELKNYYISL